jgi:DMSO/TMAO reductase YedYZ molybdopterin-dependent catalytic subunit
VEVLFEGGDTGVPSEGSARVPFARSLPLEKALHPDTLLAFEMNGAPLPPEHGGPVRLLVPGWYGMASVKWLAAITALEQPFTGFYQQDRYVLDFPGSSETLPVREMGARALITSLEQGDVVRAGSHVVSGVAWSGRGSVASVEVSLEGGGPWRPARLLGPAAPYAWRRWEFEWQPARLGRHVLRARAVDGQGNVQPDLAPWNRLGYCNNSVQPVVVEVRA